MITNRSTQIMRILSDPLRKILRDEQLDFDKLQEIRLRVGQSFRVQYDGREIVLPKRSEKACSYQRGAYGDTGVCE